MYVRRHQQWRVLYQKTVNLLSVVSEQTIPAMAITTVYAILSTMSTAVTMEVSIKSIFLNYINSLFSINLCL